MSLSELHQIERKRIFDILDVLQKRCPICSHQLQKGQLCLNVYHSSISYYHLHECPQALQERCNLFIKAKSSFFTQMKEILDMIPKEEKDDRHEGH